MLTKYVLRGVKAGFVGGIVYGAFVALVGNPLIRYAETFEEGGHAGEPVVAGPVTNTVSVVGGVLFGILLGAVVFGAIYYFLEPALPGTGGTKSFLLAGAAFITVSGAPWLVLPPQPAGVDQALPTGVRITWYVIMMVIGAVACGLALAVYNRLRPRIGRPGATVSALVPFVLVFAVALVAPENSVSGPVPDGLAEVFRGVTAVGQLGLWLVLASTHVWLLQRDRDGGVLGGSPSP